MEEGGPKKWFWGVHYFYAKSKKEKKKYIYIHCMPILSILPLTRKLQDVFFLNCHRETETETDGHGDSMTKSASGAYTLKMLVTCISSIFHHPYSSSGVNVQLG